MRMVYFIGKTVKLIPFLRTGIFHKKIKPKNQKKKSRYNLIGIMNVY